MSSCFFAAFLTPARHAVKVDNTSGLTFLCIMQWLTHFPPEYFISMSKVFLLLLKSCEVRCKKIGEKIKLSKSSSHHYDDSVATIHMLRSDQSAYYFIFHHVY